MKFNWKQWLNGVIIIPEDTRDIVKYITTIVLALLFRYGFEVDEFTTIIIGLIIKALADRVHFYLKYDN